MQTHKSTTQKDPKLIKEVLQQNFQKLLLRADLFTQISQKLPAWLPPELATQVKVCNIHAAQLTLSVPNAAIATLVRYQQPNILGQLKEHFPNCHIRSILTKVKNR